MSFKVAADTSPEVRKAVVVREYDEETDQRAVEEMERRCEIGQPGKTALVTDTIGDPIGRVRNFPLHVMLIAEISSEDEEEGREIVGVIRGCLKTVTNGRKSSNGVPLYEKLVYILGLRVSPTHRRLGVGTKLVQHLEEWCKEKGATYAYMATDCSNKPSINLFTIKHDYRKFRTPAVLVQPVHAHYKPLPSSTAILKIPPHIAELIYRRLFIESEFFPRDVDNILNNKLNLGTFIAVPKKLLSQWDLKSGVLPQSFAMLSVWNTKEVFKLQVKGVSKLKYACCAGSRVLDNLMPWLGIPSIPNIFKPFGVYFLYGLHMEGKGASQLMKSLCSYVHNMARDDRGCGAIVAEVGQRDPVRDSIPHWRRFSWAEDLWCAKKLAETKEEDERQPLDWARIQPTSQVIFVDPRDC